MFVLMLACGVYLGGVVVSWMQLWVRNEGELDEGLIMGALAWPAGVIVAIAIGRAAFREELGMLSNEEVEDLVIANAALRRDLRVVEERLESLEFVELEDGRLVKVVEVVEEELPAGWFDDEELEARARPADDRLVEQSQAGDDDVDLGALAGDAAEEQEEKGGRVG